MHGHEGFLTLVLHNRGIIATFHRFKKSASNKTLVVCKLFVRPGKPLPELGVLPFLNGRKIDNYNEHDSTLLVRLVLAGSPAAMTGGKADASFSPYKNA
jgi:hypothetical protein